MRLPISAVWVNIYPSGGHLSTGMLQCDGWGGSIALWFHNMRFAVERMQPVDTVACMPRGKSNKPKAGAAGEGPKGDRHKPSYQCRISMAFVPGLEKLAQLHGGDVPDEVRTAIREYLQKHNLWPKTLNDVSESGTE